MYKKKENANQKCVTKITLSSEGKSYLMLENHACRGKHFAQNQYNHTYQWI